MPEENLKYAKTKFKYISRNYKIRNKRTRS